MVHRVYRAHDEACANVFGYMECLYNPRGRHSKPRYLKHQEFRGARYVVRFGDDLDNRSCHWAMARNWNGGER